MGYQSVGTSISSRSLRAAGYQSTVEAKLGTTFRKGPVKGSVLKSGVVILEGVADMDEAIRLRGSLLPGV